MSEPTHERPPATRLRVAPDPAAGADRGLDDAARHYLTRVRRLRDGAEIELFDGAGGLWRGTLTDGGARVTGLVAVARDPRALAGPRLALAQAVPRRAGGMDWVVQKATELGVAELVPLLTARSVARPERADRWRRIASEAARQCERADVPEIHEPEPFAEFVARWRVAQDGPAWLLWERAPADAGLRDAVRARPAAPDAATFVVGPEGGFDPREVELARDAGIAPVGLGARILRAETAGVAALTALQWEWGGLG